MVVAGREGGGRGWNEGGPEGGTRAPRRGPVGLRGTTRRTPAWPWTAGPAGRATAGSSGRARPGCRRGRQDLEPAQEAVGTARTAFDVEAGDAQHQGTRAAGGAGPLKPVVGRDSRPRYSRPMKLSIELSPAQVERLRFEAERLGLTPEDLARAAIADLLASAGDDFKAAAERVLKKNEELYRRLA